MQNQAATQDPARRDRSALNHLTDSDDISDDPDYHPDEAYDEDAESNGWEAELDDADERPRKKVAGGNTHTLIPVSRSVIAEPVLALTSPPPPLSQDEVTQRMRELLPNDIPDDVLHVLSTMQSAFLDQVSDLSSEVAHLREAQHQLLTSSNTTGISSVPYTFEPEVLEELEKHPIDHTRFSSQEFTNQMRLVPQARRQVVVTEAKPEDRPLLSQLKGTAKEKVMHWIPSMEVILSNQLRGTAYLYDMILKLSKDDAVWSRACLEAPSLPDILKAARFSFISATGARQRLAAEKLTTVATSLGVNLPRDRDDIRETQRPSLFGVNGLSAMYQQARHVSRVRAAFGQDRKRGRSGQVFGRGSRRGSSDFPRITSAQAPALRDHEAQPSFQKTHPTRGSTGVRSRFPRAMQSYRGRPSGRGRGGSNQ